MFLDSWFNKVNIVKKENNKVKLKDVKLPIQIEYLDGEEIYELVQENLLKTYQSLDYSKKEQEELEEKEWSNWEMSLIMKFYKIGLSLKVVEPEKTFPHFITNYNSAKIKPIIDKLVSVYVNKDKRGHSESRLRKDVFWTPMEITYFLYYLSIYKET